MNNRDEYDADEIFREHEDTEDAAGDPESVDELDFENARKKSYNDLVGDMEEPGDLME